MRRPEAARAIRGKPGQRGHCVVCGAVGKGTANFICQDCGDPLGTMLYCLSCGRRLALDPVVARRFLQENGYDIEDMTGLVLKVTRCSRCMGEDDTVDITIYRLRLP